MNPQALAALRDIHLPSSPAWWTIPELWLAAVCMAALAGWLGWRHRRNRLLHCSLRELARLSETHARDGDAVRLARGLSQLLRHHAAACFPQAGVEGLAGSAWLAFLDAHGGQGLFTQGAGAILESLPYRAGGTADTGALLAAVRHWLRENPR